MELLAGKKDMGCQLGNQTNAVISILRYAGMDFPCLQWDLDVTHFSCEDCLTMYNTDKSENIRAKRKILCEILDIPM